MWYKTDKILKKNFEKKQLLKKNIEKNKIDIAKKCDSWDSNLQLPAWRTQDRAIDFWATEARWISLFKKCI